MTLAKQINNKSGTAKGLEALSIIYKQKGDYKRALQFHEEFKKMNDSLVEAEDKKKVTEMQTRFNVENKEKEIIILKKDSQLQQLALTKQQSQKNFFILISFLIMVVAFILYTRYRLKVRVTRQLRLEMAERKRAETELLQSMKMEAVGILAGGIAHDFNNLIAVILGNVTMVAEDSSLSPQNTKMLGNAEKVCSQAADLSAKLVIFSKGGWLVRKQLSINFLLDYIFDHYPEMQPLLNNRNIPDHLPKVNGDERQLRQVILNLLQNAKEAIEPEMLSARTSGVTIEAQMVSMDLDNHLELDAIDYIPKTISDKGRGISHEIMKNIFDPYFSTKNTFSKKGLGLGLAICYSIIKKHNGHITIESEEGKGTNVTLYIPCCT